MWIIVHACWIIDEMSSSEWELLVMHWMHDFLQVEMDIYSFLYYCCSIIFYSHMWGYIYLLCCCHCIVTCDASYVVMLWKRWVTSSKRGLVTCTKLRVGDQGSERGLGLCEELFVESIPHTWVESMLHYIT